MIRLAGVLCVVALFGCGLVDSSIADISLSLPSQDVSIDSAQWNLADEERLPVVDCSADASICAQSTDALCGNGGDCVSSCVAASSTCDLGLDISIVQSLNIGEETPELKNLDGKPLVSVTISRVGYEVSANTFNVDVPALSVYLAPDGVEDFNDSMATEIGVVGPVAAGDTSPGEMSLTEEGRSLLTTYIKTYQTPFNILIGSDIRIGSGELMPKGRLDLSVQIVATAGL